MLGRRIKELREEKGVTQKELASYLGVTDRSVGYYESEERTPPPDILDKIANYFNVSVDYLLGRENTKHIHNHNKSLEDYIKEAESLMLFGDIVDEKDKEAILTAIKIAYETAIKKNKDQNKDNK